MALRRHTYSLSFCHIVWVRSCGPVSVSQCGLGIAHNHSEHGHRECKHNRRTNYLPKNVLVYIESPTCSKHTPDPVFRECKLARLLCTSDPNRSPCKFDCSTSLIVASTHESHLFPLISDDMSHFVFCSFTAAFFLFVFNQSGSSGVSPTRPSLKFKFTHRTGIVLPEDS